MVSLAAYTDEQLLQLLKGSSEPAFNEIYHRYWKLLFSVAANKCGNLTDAEEMVQEVFADLWKRRETVEIKTSLKSYLAAAVKFQVYTLLAKKHREQQGVEYVTAGEVLTPEQEMDFKNLQIHVHEKISALPEKCQLIYLMKEQGMSNKEIAASLDITVKAVEKQTTSAYRRLRTGMDYILFICDFIAFDVLFLCLLMSHYHSKNHVTFNEILIFE